MPRTEKRRLCTMKLSATERASIAHGSGTVVRRPVEWSHPFRVPAFDRAYVDPGGTDIWGPGPYLKVPDQDVRDGSVYIDRVFCPWGYPPRRLRVMWSPVSLAIMAVGLSQSEAVGWEWVLTLGAA